MDFIILVGVASALLIIILTTCFFRKARAPEKPVATGVPQPINRAIPRRAQVVRNQRNRAQHGAAVQPAQQHDAQNDQDSDDDADDVERPTTDFGGEKVGAKKRAKLEAKAEKKVQRENELRVREEKKKKDDLASEERKKLEDQEAAEEKQREEAERLAREEKERQEYEEYMKMKEAFSVEEEGFEEGDEDEKENQLQQFVSFIKDNKVVVLEDLAAEFKLKTQAVIDRIADLQNDGILTGVIDDRGKFIYISEDELKSVAKFIKQRGRVSILDLAESSNSLIHLKPISTAE